jgi:hypothetical protein
MSCPGDRYRSTNKNITHTQYRSASSEPRRICFFWGSVTVNCRVTDATGAVRPGQEKPFAGFFHAAGWLIVAGCLQHRNEVGLWPFHLPFVTKTWDRIGNGIKIVLLASLILAGICILMGLGFVLCEIR